MARNEININVRQSVKAAKGASGALQSMREGSGQSQEMIRNLSRSPTEKEKGKATSNQIGYLRSMSRDIQSQVKEQKQQTMLLRKGFANMDMRLKMMYRQQSRSGGGGGGGGGGEVGNVKSSTPVLGMLVGMLTFAIAAIQRIGKAYEAKMMEQVNTAGAVGLTHGLGPQRMYAAEFGQYAKARYMEGGTEFERNRQAGVNQTVADYKDVFGLDAATVGRTTGQFSVVNQGGGEALFGQMISQIVKEGGRSQTQAMIEGLSETMQESIALGFDNSKYVQSMATSMTNLYRYSRVDNAQAVKAAIMGFQAQQTGINKGKVDSLMQFKMYNVAGSNEFLKTKKGRSILKKYGYGTSDADIESMDVLSRSYVSQLAQKEEGEAVRQLTMQKIIDPYIKGGTDKDFRRAVEFLTPVLQNQYGQDLSTQQVEALVAERFSQKTGNAPTYAQEVARRRQVDPTTEEARFKANVNSTPLRAKQQAITREALLLGTAGQKAYKAMVRMENSMMNFATKVAPAVGTAFEALSEGIKISIDGITKVTEDLMKGVKVYQDTGSFNEARKAMGIKIFGM